MRLPTLKSGGLRRDITAEVNDVVTRQRTVRALSLAVSRSFYTVLALRCCSFRFATYEPAPFRRPVLLMTLIDVARLSTPRNDERPTLSSPTDFVLPRSLALDVRYLPSKKRYLRFKSNAETINLARYSPYNPSIRSLIFISRVS